MLEAKAQQGALWKKLIECLKDMVNEANFDCSPGGISIQAMDTSHVALVNLLLRESGFASYQCETNSVLGLNLTSLSKVLRIVEGGDALVLRHEDDSDVITLISENSDASKKVEYQLKLMEIEAEALGIPDLAYKSSVSLSSAEFAKIIRDMSIFGDTVTITVDSEGVKFSSAGDIGEGFALLKLGGGAADTKRKVKAENGAAVKSEVKDEKTQVKKEVKEDDDDAPLSKRFAGNNKESQPKESRAGTATDIGVEVDVEEPLSLSFALRFMNTFAKGASLSDRVTLFFAKDSPCLIEYKLEGLGFLRYYLAPKVDESEQ